MAAFEYEKEPCGRCGGSGRYSFNAVDRDRCYGCGGTGQRLTKRGRAAADFAHQMLDLPIQDVQLGQRVRYTDAMSGKRTTITVQQIERQQMGKVKRGDEWLPLYVITLHGHEHKISAGENVRVSLIPTEAHIAELEAYQASLTKAGKPRKRARA